MLTSSPTISAPNSPSAFQRPYHAARRTSSSCAHSPRLNSIHSQVSGASSRRSAASARSRSPQVRRRDAGTQFTPHYADASTQSTPSLEAVRLRDPAVRPENDTANPRQGETSAELVVTEPPEPNLRIDPQPHPPAPPQTIRPARRTPKEAARQEDQPDGADTAPQEQASPAKRARPQEPNVKVMPLKYEWCDVKDLGVLISDMLMELVRLNDGFPLRDGQLTRFHSRAPPGISVRDYLNRLIVHATLSPPILLSMVFYVDKLCTMYPAFTISSLTVHRFLITAATVAAKGLSDSFWTNSLYARVGGVSVRELALLELEFLRRLEWRIVPKPETLVDYYKGLVERGEGYIMEQESETPRSNSVSEQSQPQTATPEADPGAGLSDS